MAFERSIPALDFLGDRVPYAQYRNTTAQTCNGGWVRNALLVNTKVRGNFDLPGAYGSLENGISTFYIPEGFGGLWSITMSVYFAANNAGGQHVKAILVSTPRGMGWRHSQYRVDSNQAINISVTQQVFLNDGDWFAPLHFNNAGVYSTAHFGTDALSPAYGLFLARISESQETINSNTTYPSSLLASSSLPY